VSCDAAIREGKLADQYVGQEYIQNIKVGATDAPVRAQFAGKDLVTHLTMAAAPETQLAIGDGVGASILDRVPMVMVTRNGTEATFLAILEPVRNGRPPAVSGVEMAAKDGAFSLTVRRGASADVVTLTADNALAVTSDGKSVLTNR
jgi:hypothetical protein